MSFIEGVGRDQQTLFPEVLDDYIPADHPVRFIDAYVNSLDLAALAFERATAADTGRPGYDPADLLKLYIYGYVGGICSSRKLERETVRNIEVLWLIRKLHPDFKTIAEFRRKNIEALPALFREFTLLCKRLDLFGAELVAIDGSKFRAVNSKKRNYSRPMLEEIVQAVDERITQYLQTTEAADRSDERAAGAGVDRGEELKRLQGRAAEVRAMLAELDATGETQISLTDRDSRTMKVRVGTDVCYNAQTAVDDKHKLIVAAEVTNEPTDRNWLARMAVEAKEAMGAERLSVVADKGYSSAREVEACLEANITAYLPKPETSANKALGLFTKNDFRYDAARDVYICPAGEELTFRHAAHEEGRDIRYYRTYACRHCPLRSQCTRSNSRRISRSANEHVLEQMNERVAAHPEILRKRKTIVEHPFGTIKRWMNQAYFLTRGLQNVRGEFSLTALAYNLKRVLTIVGVPALLEAIA
jgi:transposase